MLCYVLLHGWPTFWKSGSKMMSKYLGGPKLCSKKPERDKNSIFLGGNVFLLMWKVKKQGLLCHPKRLCGPFMALGPWVGHPFFIMFDKPKKIKLNLIINSNFIQIILILISAESSLDLFWKSNISNIISKENFVRLLFIQIINWS